MEGLLSTRPTPSNVVIVNLWMMLLQVMATFSPTRPSGGGAPIYFFSKSSRNAEATYCYVLFVNY